MPRPLVATAEPRTLPEDEPRPVPFGWFGSTTGPAVTVWS